MFITHPKAITIQTLLPLALVDVYYSTSLELHSNDTESKTKCMKLHQASETKLLTNIFLNTLLWQITELNTDKNII